MEVVPLTDFQHGGVAFKEGVVPTSPISDALANELERAGLVRVKMALSPPRNKMQPDPLNKSEADPGKAPAGGEGTPSASSPAAQVSPEKTATPPKRGRGRPRKTGT